MRITHLLVAGAVAVSTVAATLPSPTTVAEDTSTERLIVKFEGSALPADLATTLDRLDVRGVALETINSVAVTGPKVAVDRIAHRDDVVAVHRQRKLQMHLASSVPYIGGGDALAGTADTYSYIVGETTQSGERPATFGADTTVAILDTGIFDAHPDLMDSVVAHRNFELAYAVNDFLDPVDIDTWSEATGPSAKEDDIGHGTHVAGIVAGRGVAAQGRTNDNKGVAPAANLVDLRIAAGPVQGLVNDMGWEANAIAAFDWLIRHHDDPEFGPNGIEVNTNSWGLLPEDLYDGPNFDPLEEILAQVEDEGIVTVFSAGNDGPGDDVRDDTVPNGLPEVISVAASCHPNAHGNNGCRNGKPDEAIGSFSSRGASVDIAAPGVDIVSAMNPASDIWALGQLGGDWSGASPQDAYVNRAAYGSLDGTSMAAPHAAGVVALLLSINHDLTPTEVRTIIGATAKDILAPGRDEEAGYGLIQIMPGLRAAQALKDGLTLDEVFPGFTFESCTPLSAARVCSKS